MVEMAIRERKERRLLFVKMETSTHSGVRNARWATLLSGGEAFLQEKNGQSRGSSCRLNMGGRDGSSTRCFSEPTWTWAIRKPRVHSYGALTPL